MPQLACIEIETLVRGTEGKVCLTGAASAVSRPMRNASSTSAPLAFCVMVIDGALHPGFARGTATLLEKARSFRAT
ncbi:MAG TPA: hypothetical protein VJU59_43460 [Paraburkholderia sp.]|jgi:hypothetical protein|uniref:hypothetical protein n=1 Tax=Paraburkholderia sp. TaxID=1926495 RepID=UPI002B467DEA|nr:hypothetical protein [Paraburkholderia sp.]HKR46451.1 hypothetical protein [Paraburkholderia sp.]